MDNLDLQLLRDSLLAAVREDVGAGDITSHATIPANARATGRYTTKQTVVVAGVPVIREIMRLVDSDLQFDAIASDGCSVATGAVLAEVHGSARSILAVERTSLNLLQRMCGIATLTHQYVDRIAGTRTRIVDTRKTAPGLRVLDKYAVSCGGGMNHRMGLFDGVLIKNNHLIFHPSVAHAIQEARRNLGHLVKIEVEVRTLDELRTAVDGDADVILLDNFDAEQTRRAVGIVNGRIPLESSGGVTLETVRSFAEAGVDYISVGALTHSAPAADIHLRVTAE
ncbi:MAG: carboxylating nicotinate-nucleotide diphosphorylase [Acidobacteria bacterium]|nr:MAG: carboxylating nicotinate-nucleotide diphosphorylase [Acidobacteriota bacterium]